MVDRITGRGKSEAKLMVPEQVVPNSTPLLQNQEAQAEP
jgi:hypothetical protein